MIWFTSDLHFSHKNICKFTDRQWVTTPEDHDEWLIDLWNSQVSKGSTVVHLGDFCFSSQFETVAKIVNRLNGQKIFIKGNHDNREVLNKLKQEGLIANWHDYKEIKLEDNSVCLFHFPISVWHKQHYGSIMLHGHCHSHFQGDGKIMDVGLDAAYNYFGKHCFFSEKDVLEYMQSKEIVVKDHRKGE